MRTALRLAVAVGCLAPLLGCGSAAKEPHVEDTVRELAPVPACVMPLGVRRAHTGLVRSLSEQSYWRAVSPSFDVEKQALPEDAIGSTGRNILPIPSSAAVNGSGATRSRSSRENPAGVGRKPAQGALASDAPLSGRNGGRAPRSAVRAKDDFSEVYAVGVYRGQTKRPISGSSASVPRWL